eukprot:UN27437
MEDASTINNSLKCTKSKCIRSADKKPIRYYAVYDGHGGSSCSKWLEENLYKILERKLTEGVDVKKAIDEAFEEADRQIIEENPEIESGSTCISVLIEEATNTIWCANVGDSRAIMIDKKGKSKPLSDDQP